MVRAAGAQASTLARLIWPASSTTRTSSTGSGRANSGRHHVQATAPTTSTVRDRSAASTSALPLSTIAAACVGPWPPFGFWPMRTGRVELDGGLGHLVEHLPDDLVAVGDDADAFPLGDEVHDHPRARCRSCPSPGAPGSAGPRRGIARTIRVAASTAVSPGRRSGAPGPCPTSRRRAQQQVADRRRHRLAGRASHHPRPTRPRRRGAPSEGGSPPALRSGRRPAARSTGAAPRPRGSARA